MVVGKKTKLGGIWWLGFVGLGVVAIQMVGFRRSNRRHS